MPKPKKETYSYPDKDDKITCSLIKKAPQQWQNEENQILNQIEAYIKEKPHRWLFDAGCGTGRLLLRFQSYFDEILAVDPDAAQIKKAELLVKKQGFASKVTFKRVPIEKLKWAKNSIDVILCSHVIQHTHTEGVPLILQKFKEVSKSGTQLFILTSFSEAQDYYVKDQLCNDSFCESQISVDEFNSLIVNNEGKLPVHFFSLKTLQDNLETAGFSMLGYWLFHNRSRAGEGHLARDILVVAKA